MYVERRWLLITHTDFHGDTNKNQMHKNSNVTVSMGWTFDQQKIPVILLTWSKPFLKVDRLPLALWICNAKLEWLHYFHTALGPNRESWTRIIILHTLRMMDLPPMIYVLTITVKDVQESVQFRMAFTHSGKPKINMLHPCFSEVSSALPLKQFQWSLMFKIQSCLHVRLWEHFD